MQTGANLLLVSYDTLKIYKPSRGTLQHGYPWYPSSSLTYCDSTHILKCSILWSVLKWDLRARNAMKAEKKRENVQSESIFPLLRISLCFQWWLKREVTLNINNYLCSVASWGIKEKSIYKLLMLFTAKIILQAVRVGFFFLRGCLLSDS